MPASRIERLTSPLRVVRSTTELRGPYRCMRRDNHHEMLPRVRMDTSALHILRSIRICEGRMCVPLSFSPFG